MEKKTNRAKKQEVVETEKTVENEEKASLSAPVFLQILCMAAMDEPSRAR